jgi:hypothetical protein
MVDQQPKKVQSSSTLSSFADNNASNDSMPASKKRRLSAVSSHHESVSGDFAAAFKARSMSPTLPQVSQDVKMEDAHMMPASSETFAASLPAELEESPAPPSSKKYKKSSPTPVSKSNNSKSSSQKLSVKSSVQLSNKTKEPKHPVNSPTIPPLTNTGSDLSVYSESDDQKDSPNVCGGINGMCHFCGAKKTGQWRRGPAGQRTLCNACGINWTKKVKAEASRSGISIAEAEKIVGDDSSKFRKSLYYPSASEAISTDAPSSAATVKKSSSSISSSSTTSNPGTKSKSKSKPKITPSLSSPPSPAPSSSSTFFN